MTQDDFFYFKEFTIKHAQSTLKVSTDSCLLGAWAELSHAKNLLDIGTGNGILALFSAQKNGNLFIDAIEPETLSYNEAVFNFSQSPWKDRIQATQIKLQEYRTESTYDAIICNPPYYAEQRFLVPSDLSRRRMRSDVDLNYNDLIRYVCALLKKEGSFQLILPSTEYKIFEKIAMEQGLYLNRIGMIHSKESSVAKRVLLSFNFNLLIKKEEVICIYDEKGGYHHNYRQLLQPFLRIF